MITQPLFWKRSLDDVRAYVFKDGANTYALTVDNSSLNLTLVVGRQISNLFTLKDTVTSSLYTLAVNVDDGAVDVVAVTIPINVVDYLPLTDTVTGEHFQIQVVDGSVQIADAPLAESYGLAELLPKVYPDVDVDSSLADFIQVYDDQHTEQRAIVEKLATIRTPSLAPLDFVPDIADALGSPFPFMSAQRWQRGNRLASLPHIYAHRGSVASIIDTIRYLVGVEVDIISYQWILGVSRLP